MNNPRLRTAMVSLRWRLLVSEMVKNVFNVKMNSSQSTPVVISAQSTRPDFDEAVAPQVKEFWQKIRNPESTYPQRVRQHPFYALYGEELSKIGYEQVRGAQARQAQALVEDIMEREQGYESYLERLAVKIVSEVWDCPEEILEAHLGFPPASLGEDDEQEDEIDIDEPAELDEEELRHYVDRRISMNTLTHGAAIHHMMSAHHLGRKQIENFDDDLIDLYDQVAKVLHKTYWQVYVESAANAQMAGAETIVWSDEDEDGTPGAPKVVAYGVMFPVLLQELSKGVMELLTAHSLSTLSPQAQQHVIEQADRIDEEQWLIQVGPQLWRDFLKVVPRDYPLATIVTEFSLAEPSEVQEVLETVVDNPERATEILNSIAQKGLEQ